MGAIGAPDAREYASAFERYVARVRDVDEPLAELAGQAAQAQGTRDREVAYGKVLATCGGCHRMVSRFAGPDRH